MPVISKKYALSFSSEISTRPITYRLVKDFDLVLNILQARIDPEAMGRLLIELTGEEDDIRRGLDFLRDQGITVHTHSHDISWNADKCVDCGACTGVCKPQAFQLNPETFQLEFDRSKCVLCSICVEACPVGAIEVTL